MLTLPQTKALVSSSINSMQQLNIFSLKFKYLASTEREGQNTKKKKKKRNFCFSFDEKMRKTFWYNKPIRSFGRINLLTLNVKKEEIFCANAMAAMVSHSPNFTDFSRSHCYSCAIYRLWRRKKKVFLQNTSLQGIKLISSVSHFNFFAWETNNNQAKIEKKKIVEKLY